MIEPQDCTNQPLPALPPRTPTSHKGNFGRALLVGGSVGMSGAIALAGRATLRSGAGLVTLAIPASIQNIVAAFDPCYMTLALADEEGSLLAASAAQLPHQKRPDRLQESTDVWAVGPGLSCTEDTVLLVSRLYQDVDRPMVIDADGLNCLAQRPEALSNPGGPRLLTPHPGEFVRLALAVDPDWESALAAHSSKDNQREASAAWLAGHDPTAQTTVVLKGHHTIIADAERAAVNTTGNPGMATAGSGDVLTGILTALLCQGLSPWNAARLGTHVHGLAGDFAAKNLGQVSLVASDLVKYLPAAFIALGKPEA